MSDLGSFNFLLSDAEFLYAHRSSLLFYVSRECFAQTECLRSEELTVRLARLQKEPQRLALVATDPLTSDEPWLPLPARTVIVFSKGSRVE
jgi:predicted glutamine amidotransferase